MTIILHLITPLKPWIKSCHLSDSTSTTESLDESSTLSAPDDHLYPLDSTNPSFQLQDSSSGVTENAQKRLLG